MRNAAVGSLKVSTVYGNSGLVSRTNTATRATVRDASFCKDHHVSTTVAAKAAQFNRAKNTKSVVSEAFQALRSTLGMNCNSGKWTMVHPCQVPLRRQSSIPSVAWMSTTVSPVDSPRSDRAHEQKAHEARQR